MTGQDRLRGGGRRGESLRVRGRVDRCARRAGCPSGDVLLVAPGDVLPVDGAVASGIAVLDESALTGEARPVRYGDAKAQIAPFVRAAARRGLLRRHPMACANLVAGPFDLESQGSLLPSAPDSADVNKPRNQTQTRQ